MVSGLSIEKIQKYLIQDVGYRKNIKVYFRKPRMTTIDWYKILWNDDGLKEMSEYAKEFGYIKFFADHSSEKQSTANVLRDVEVGNDDRESDDDYEEESDRDNDETLSDMPLSEDDEDIELYEGRLLSNMIMEGKINPLRNNNLTDMHIEGERCEHDSEVQYEEVEVQTKKKVAGDDHFGDKPTF